MKKLGALASIVIGIFFAGGCSRQDSREATDNAQKQLEVTRDKVREDLKHADAQTREDLDKARDQLHHALNRSESDADRARDKLRDRDDSHQ